MMLQVVGHNSVPEFPAMWIQRTGLIAKVASVNESKWSAILPTLFDQLVFHYTTYDQGLITRVILPGLHHGEPSASALCHTIYILVLAQLAEIDPFWHIEVVMCNEVNI